MSSKHLTSCIATVVFLCAMGAQSYLKEAAPIAPWYKSAVLENSRPVVVKFGADWCPPCQSMDAVLPKMKREFQGVRFAKINIDEEPELFKRFGRGTGIPQLVIYRDGKAIARTKGFGGEQWLRDWLKNNLK